MRSHIILTGLEEALSVTVQRYDENAALHVIVALDAHFRQLELRIPAVVFWVNTV